MTVMRILVSSKRCAELLGLGRRGDGSVDVVQGLDHQHSAFNTVCHQWNSFRRSPSEEFGITVHSVCILTGTQTHLKLIQSCTIATGGSLTTSTLKLVGVTFFSAFGRPPPATLGSGSTSRYPLAATCTEQLLDVHIQEI